MKPFHLLFTLLDTLRPSGPEAWAGGQDCRRQERDEDRLDLGQPAHFQLREAADDFAPAEAFLDAFALPLADRIAEAGRDPCGTAVLRALPFLLTVPLMATCGSIPRAFSPSTKASAS